MCGFIKLTETLIISHKPVKQKAREKTTSVEVALGEWIQTTQKGTWFFGVQQVLVHIINNQ